MMLDPEVMYVISVCTSQPAPSYWDDQVCFLLEFPGTKPWACLLLKQWSTVGKKIRLLGLHSNTAA
jgi:hypothetical protein